MKIIGLTGRKGSGKDAAATALVRYTNLKLAEPLKTMLHALLTYQEVPPDVIYEMLEGRLKESPCKTFGGQTPRHAMQTLGTEWGRDLMGKDFWVTMLKNKAQHYDCVVVTDVRFPNEVHAIEEMGGMIIRIVRPSLNVSDAHPSEVLIDTLPVHTEVINDGTLTDLQDTIRRLVDH